MNRGKLNMVSSHAISPEAAIAAIAEEFRRPISEVAALFHGELAGMRAGAAIVDFLAVLAEKRVRARYRGR